RLAAAGIATARQDAELLLARVLGTTRLALRVNPDHRVSAAGLVTLTALVARRVRQEPLQYLFGEVEFCGLALRVGPGVFIPRAETEALVERAITAVGAGARRSARPQPPGIRDGVSPGGDTVAVDLCTGSGAVACALAVRRPEVRVWTVEREAAAAAWARVNVTGLQL